MTVEPSQQRARHSSAARRHRASIRVPVNLATLLLVVLPLVSTSAASAAPPSPATAASPTASAQVLKPDVKDAIIGLISDVGFERAHPGGSIFRSISIAPSTVVFRLMGPGDAETSAGRAEIRLYPRGARPKARRPGPVPATCTRWR